MRFKLSDVLEVEGVVHLHCAMQGLLSGAPIIAVMMHDGVGKFLEPGRPCGWACIYNWTGCLPAPADGPRCMRQSPW
jgi:hypothetical protein